MTARLRELRELMERATKGPWRIDHADWDRDEKRVEVFAGADGEEIVKAAYDDDYYDGITCVRLEISKSDAALVVAMRNNLDALLAVAEAAQEEVALDDCRTRPGMVKIRAALARLGEP